MCRTINHLYTPNNSLMMILCDFERLNLVVYQLRRYASKYPSPCKASIDMMSLNHLRPALRSPSDNPHEGQISITQHDRLWVQYSCPTFPSRQRHCRHGATKSTRAAEVVSSRLVCCSEEDKGGGTCVRMGTRAGRICLRGNC